MAPVGEAPAPEQIRAPNKRCFIVGPIGDVGTDTRIKADWLLKAIIRPVMVEFGFDVRRSDEIPEPGMIDSQVINNTIDSDLVIADLTDHNPNAFYELAIRHMVENPIIHMVEMGTNLPFDINPFRTIHFSLKEFSDHEKARNDLRDQLRAIQQPDYAVENPVTRARGKLEVLKKSTPEEKILLGYIDELTARISRLENRDSTRDIGKLFKVRPSIVNSILFQLEPHGSNIEEIVKIIHAIMSEFSSGLTGHYVISVEEDFIVVQFGRPPTVEVINQMMRHLQGFPGVRSIKVV